jgi:hypothetical protein
MLTDSVAYSVSSLLTLTTNQQQREQLGQLRTVGDGMRWEIEKLEEAKSRKAKK